MTFVSYLHDPDNLYVPILKKTNIPDYLKGSVVAVSKQTTEEVVNLVKSLGFKTVEGGLYGIARINALKESFNNSHSFYFLCDFDKLLHWLNTNNKEFEQVYNSEQTSDLIIISRSIKALTTYPETWVQTEQIAERIMAKIIRKNLDFMNGPLILSEKASEVIVKNAKETGVGSCSEFCLLVFQANLTIDSVEVEGLTWEDPDRYVDLINKHPTFDDWKYETYHSLYEWRKRVDFLHNQVEVMIRLTEEPINPKYPAVQNKIFDVKK